MKRFLSISAVALMALTVNASANKKGNQPVRRELPADYIGFIADDRPIEIHEGEAPLIPVDQDYGEVAPLIPLDQDYGEVAVDDRPFAVDHRMAVDAATDLQRAAITFARAPRDEYFIIRK